MRIVRQFLPKLLLESGDYFEQLRDPETRVYWTKVSVSGIDDSSVYKTVPQLCLEY